MLDRLIVFAMCLIVIMMIFGLGFVLGYDRGVRDSVSPTAAYEENDEPPCL